jgi:hypothetical protein
LTLRGALLFARLMKLTVAFAFVRGNTKAKMAAWDGKQDELMEWFKVRAAGRTCVVMSDRDVMMAVRGGLSMLVAAATGAELMLSSHCDCDFHAGVFGVMACKLSQEGPAGEGRYGDILMTKTIIMSMM